MSIDPLLLATTRLLTYQGSHSLTSATGFFFERAGRLFVVTSGHVLREDSSGHHPDRLELTLHTSLENLSQTVVQSVLLYDNGLAVWRAARDAAGPVDVAVIELDRRQLPPNIELVAFGPDDLLVPPTPVEIGTALLMPGFPLGFYDTVYHLPVVRQATLASAFGIRFQGQGYFLTDARAHRGSSGSPVVVRWPGAQGPLKWRLLGIHSLRFDMASRDEAVDESLGLNCAWYADVLGVLTQ